MNAIANGLKDNKSYFSRFFADLDRMNTQMTKTMGLGTRIRVTGGDIAQDITVQIIEDGIVTHCNHAGAHYGVEFDHAIFANDIHEIPFSAMLCDKCPAYTGKDEVWHE